MIGPGRGGRAQRCLATPHARRRPTPGDARRRKPPLWGWSGVPDPERRRAAGLRAGGSRGQSFLSVTSVDLDLAGLGQHVDDVGLEVGVVHAGLPELARVPVILPVVVPVAPAVSPETVHVHLQGRAVQVTPTWEPGRGRAWGSSGEGGSSRSGPTTREAASQSVPRARDAWEEGTPKPGLSSLTLTEGDGRSLFSSFHPSDCFKNNAPI